MQISILSFSKLKIKGVPEPKGSRQIQGTENVVPKADNNLNMSTMTKSLEPYLRSERVP
jgi:hypothetical protein